MNVDEVPEGRRARSRRSLLVGVAAMIALTGCTPAVPEPVPVDEARAQYREMLPPLQESMLQGADASWAEDSERVRLDDNGICRWSPGDATTEITLPEDDAAAWDARREAINPVLTEHGFDEVGDAMRRNGAPAYGFFSDRADGAGVHVYTAAGTTVVRVFGIPVEESACR